MVGAGLYGRFPVRQVVAGLRRAEDLGFAAVWLNDSQCACRDSYVAMSVAASATERIRLGLSVTNPVTRDLSVTASALYSLSELCGGRLVCGLGRGEASVGLAGLRRASLAELRRAVLAVRALCAGEAVDVGGRGVRLAYARQPVAVPLYVAGGGPRTLALGGEVGDGVLVTANARADPVRVAVDRVAEGARRAGRDPGAVRLAVRLPFFRAGEPRSVAHMRGRVAMRLLSNDPFLLSEDQRRRLDRVRPPGWQEGDPLGPAMEALVDEMVGDFALGGPPERWTPRIEAIEALGVDELNVTFDDADPVAAMEEFARGAGRWLSARRS